MSFRLFHISDQPGVRQFEPRPVTQAGRETGEPLVWAVDQDHVHNYLLPRDCPRVTYYAIAGTNPADVERLIGPTTAKYIVAVEKRWWPEIRRQSLYRYEFLSSGFEVKDAGAGYYICRHSVQPISETTIEDIPGALLEYNVELRIMPSLWRLREAVIHSSLQFSIIRMRNAEPPAEGFGAYHPLPQ
jgi:hypothetical protein